MGSTEALAFWSFDGTDSMDDMRMLLDSRFEN